MKLLILTWHILSSVMYVMEQKLCENFTREFQHIKRIRQARNAPNGNHNKLLLRIDRREKAVSLSGSTDLFS
jgi:hypothetical protein